MRSLFLLYCLLLAGFLLPPTAGAQPGQGGPAGLFKGAGAAGPQTMNAVGQKRMATLKQDSVHQSIRLVRIAGNLSQRRTLVMHVGGNRALAPEVPPAFQREHPGRGRAEKPGRGRGNRKVKLFVRRDEIKPIREGTYAWKGTVRMGRGKKKEVGSVLLIRGENREISGTIRLEGEIYKIRPLNGGVHALVEVDESKYSLGGNSPLNSGAGASDTPSKSPSSPTEASTPSQRSPSSVQKKKTCEASRASLSVEASESTSENARTTACAQRVTDVLVVYTSSAASGINIDNRIDNAIQVSNASYDNSNVYNAELDLVHSQQVGINETNLDDDLSTLQISSTIQSLRDQYDADVVVLLGEYEGAGLADEIRAEAEDAYAVVGVSRAAGGGLVFPHEVGHLQGGQHHPDDPTCSLGDPRCDPEAHRFPDAFGHRFSDTDCTLWFFDCETDYYASVMAYTWSGYYWINNDHSRVTHFSNPDVNHDGRSTGTSNRSNADALQTTVSTVENFRTSDDLRASFTVTGDPRSSERTFTAEPCGGDGTYYYTWRFSYNGPGDYGPPVTSAKSFTKSFPEGTHYAKLTVTTSGSQSDTAIQAFYVAGEETFKQADAQDTSSTSSGKTAATSARPERVALRGPAPNPVQASAELTYALPERTEVTLTVYDLMGRKVATLVAGTRSAGVHRPRLNGTALPSGTYVVRLRAGEVQKSRRITVVK